MSDPTLDFAALPKHCICPACNYDCHPAQAEADRPFSVTDRDVTVCHNCGWLLEYYVAGGVLVVRGISEKKLRFVLQTTQGQQLMKFQRRVRLSDPWQRRRMTRQPVESPSETP